jgi:hypothetical protein
LKTANVILITPEGLTLDGDVIGNPEVRSKTRFVQVAGAGSLDEGRTNALISKGAKSGRILLLEAPDTKGKNRASW